MAVRGRGSEKEEKKGEETSRERNDEGTGVDKTGMGNRGRC